ncbi:MAG: UDP-N-acetylmuramate dehydrogenase [Candidatus Eisenbacteria bacterium]|nr:UDP-N-acetylmuramate dehydrogenase [Candidatus Eisenbacteria bacterium]
MELPEHLIDRLSDLAPDGVKLSEPMARHTSFGLGGPADVLVEAPDERAFRECLSALAEEEVPTRVLGRGTNVLVRSGGIEGAVLITGSAMSRMERDGLEVSVAAGTPLSRLLGFCAGEGLMGIEGLAGIPGSVGGALVTNAGSHGVEFADVVREVTVFEPGGSPRTLGRDSLDAGYRRSTLPQRVVVQNVRLVLEEGNPREIEARQRSFLDRKWRTQPCGMRSAGCVFKNPQGEPAGLLIEKAGLKGRRVGGAVVSDQHANFILNDRGATADDVEELIRVVRETVREETGVDLELEIEILGRRTN